MNEFERNWAILITPRGAQSIEPYFLSLCCFKQRSLWTVMAHKSLIRSSLLVFRPGGVPCIKLPMLWYHSNSWIMNEWMLPPPPHPHPPTHSVCNCMQWNTVYIAITHLTRSLAISHWSVCAKALTSIVASHNQEASKHFVVIASKCHCMGNKLSHHTT